jgi:hypothetical protein
MKSFMRVDQIFRFVRGKYILRIIAKLCNIMENIIPRRSNSLLIFQQNANHTKLVEHVKHATSIEDILTIIPQFRSYHIGEQNELSYALYHSQQYLDIIKKCFLTYLEKSMQNTHKHSICADLRPLATVLTIMLPKTEICQNLRNTEFAILSNVLDLEQQGIFVFNPETPEYERNDKISTTFSELRQRVSSYFQVKNNCDIGIIFNHNGHWRCLVIRNNLAIYSDGINGNMSAYATQLCEIVSKVVQLRCYTCAEQKDMWRCGLYALRTVLFSMQQPLSDFETHFHKLETLECIIQYIEEKLIRNIIKVDMFKDNEPEKYQEKMVKCFVFYGLLKHQRHFNEKLQVDLTKLFDILKEKHIFTNFRQIADKYRHIVDLSRYAHVVEEMSKHLRNIHFKRSICDVLLSITVRNGQNMCDTLNKFPSGTIIYDDFIQCNEVIEKILDKKRDRLDELIYIQMKN